ncbi:putative zinc-binding metallopeptidase [Pedobacter nutrimenti]|uniref:putative zinc-binding metallopeptidase n=1 Tax=Pedobacter nutrimenti TaxID=1241337 RepID=UPI00292D57A9|nr:putative zinc-binding metallopeptidase [Pedobacter nutrimenti]
MKDFNKTIKLLMLLGGFVLLITSCRKTEATLTPSTTPEPGFKIPQGNHDYDQRIVSYYNRWGTYVLYKFSQQDIAWQVSTNDKFYTTVPADTLYINQQLDLIEKTFFRYYADSTLKKYLPTKFFLCSSLASNNTQRNAYLIPFSNGNFGGIGSFAVNGGNSAVSTINPAVYRGDVNFSFLKMMDLQFKMLESNVFIGLSDYTTAITGTQADRYIRGFLGVTSAVPAPSQDWQSYIQAIVSNSYAFLTDPNTTATDATNRGILSPVKDVNGLVNRKYNAIIAFYKTQYHIDLQVIGNGG